jgi:ribosome-associated protein
VTATPKAIQVANIAAAAAADKLGENIIALDVTEPMPLTDVFV